MRNSEWEPKCKLTCLIACTVCLVWPLIVRATNQPAPQEPPKATTVQAEASDLGTHEQVWAAHLSSDGKYLVSSGSYSGTVTVWDLSKKKQVMALDLESFAARRQFDADAVQGFAFNPDGRLLAGSYDENINVWEAAKGRQVHRFSGSISTGPVGFVVSGGKTEAFGGGGAGHSLGVRAVAFSPDGRLLASGSEDKSIMLWDLSKGKVARTLTGHNGGIWALAFSGDGRSLVSGSNDAAIKFWEISNGQTVRTLEGHKTGIRALALSADGRWLASGEVLAEIKLWDLYSGEAVRKLSGHPGGTSKMVFSSDSRWLASTGADGVTRLWDVAKGNEVLNFNGGGGGVAFSADGLRLLASGWSDDRVKVWQVELTQKTKN